MPKKHDPKKKLWTQKVQEKIYIVILPCPHVIQIKGREIHKKEYSISTIHLPHMCIILINMFDLSSPWIRCLILQYMWYKSMLPFFLPWVPQKPSIEVGWKEAKPWWGYIHSERHERSYGEVKLWVVFAKIFPKPQSYSRKVEETEVNTIPLFNFPNIYVRHIKIHRQR